MVLFRPTVQLALIAAVFNQVHGLNQGINFAEATTVFATTQFTTDEAQKPTQQVADTRNPGDNQRLKDQEGQGKGNTTIFDDPVTDIPDEGNDFKNPKASDPFDFMASIGVTEAIKDANQLSLGQLFVATPLINRFSILDANKFIVGGNNNLRDLIQSSFETAFGKSALVEFGKSMNKIRPHIAYAIAMSWNVEHYSVDIKQLIAKDKNINQIQLDALKDHADVHITDDKIASFGRISKEGKTSEITAYLAVVEKSFEDFVVDVQLWAIGSMGKIYSIVQNVHKAMRSANNARKYADLSGNPKLIGNAKALKKILETMHFSRGEMVGYLAKVNPVLEELIDAVLKMSMMMDENLIAPVNAAQQQNNLEITVAKKSDRDAKLGGSILAASINKVDNFIKTNQKDIEKSEKDLHDNIMAIEADINAKRRENSQWLSKIDRFTARKMRAAKQRDVLFEENNQAINKLKGQLTRNRNNRRCKLTPNRFFANVHKCKSSYTHVYRWGGGCRTKCFFFWCSRKCWADNVSYHTVTVTNKKCVDRELAVVKANQDAQRGLDKRNCDMAVQQFHADVRSFEKQQEQLFKNYEAKIKIVDAQVKAIDEAQRDAKKVSDEWKAKIQMQKQEKMRKRAKLLTLKENQIRSQKVALLAKQDLQSSMREYTSVTDTLQLTKLALREIDNALKATLRSLDKFKVQLESLKNLINEQIDNFEDINRQVTKNQAAIMNNPHILRMNMENVYNDNLQAGIGLIVMAQLYDSIFSYMAQLDEYPVGLYRPELTLKQNIARFQQFVKKMNNQKIDLDNMDTQLENLKAQKESLNKGLSERGLNSVESIAADESLKIQQAGIL